MSDSQYGNSFICPNCGGRVPGTITNISTVGPTDDPWSKILQTTDCVLCRQTIPAHLGERWNNISIEEARKEWLEVYKKAHK
jgi:hypothetical protein